MNSAVSTDADGRTVRVSGCTDRALDPAALWEAPHHTPGTVLAIVPVGAATLAIVGYLVRMPWRGGSVLPVPLAEGLVVDRDNRQVLVDSREAGLTFQEFELLDFLISNPGRVFSRGQLLDFVWGYSDEGLTRTVDVHIHRLRRKLGPEYAGCLVTVRRIGYRFTPSSR